MDCKMKALEIGLFLLGFLGGVMGCWDVGMFGGLFHVKQWDVFLYCSTCRSLLSI